ncbi:MAG: AMP-binding protein [Pseudonocardia sp.]|uniref:class I adenylate-forming enzyme family protein n=1 Tax=unclassified Pseudonocardia TaxID=2619320 RepID=UPI00086B3FBA|nr:MULTISPECIES: AMP-binding protein [unclassified Pseudonocardia]MBN9112302.1 AMP-binding protein [Pseudonocardia sp.]ODV01034.1 MAG: AMP-dependent synthetase [Pseudonocardia sp. SCN 73-27]
MQYSVADMLGMSARSRPDALAATVLATPTTPERSWTFAQVWQRVAGLAAAIADTPEGRNGRMVATLLPNGLDALLIYPAAMVAGVASVPVNTRLALPEIAHILSDSGATVVVAAGPLLDTAREVAALLDHDVTVLDLDTVPDDAPLPDPTGDPAVGQRVGAVFYTSGTTGLPKGATMTNDTWLINCFRWGWQLRLGPDDDMLVPGPLFHMSYCSFALCCWMIGGRVRIMPTFDAAVACDEFAERSTAAFLVPSMTTMISQEWERRGRTPLPAMKRMMTAGAAVSPVLLKQAYDIFPNVEISETYGWTEGGFATFELKSPDTVLDGTVGHPTVGCEILVVDEDDQLCAPGQRGEILLRTLACSSGYLNLPEATAASWTGDLIRSGDIGIMDADGRLRIVDRKNGMIITGGENVYAAEVEQVVAQHPAVLETVVLGKPHEKWGEQIVAVVVARPGETVEQDDLRAFCRDHLADYKIPRAVVVWPEALPRNSMGKLQRFVVEKSVRDAAVPAG